MTEVRKVAIILGSGLYELYSKEEERGLETKIETKYGTAEVSELSSSAYLLQRHGPAHSLPPHLINYRANIESLRKLGVRYVLSTASVGAINPRLGVGTYVVVDQFIDETRSRALTFYTEHGEPFSHTDMTHPYSEKARNVLIAGLRKSRVKFQSKGTYVCTEGPRFETPAEIKMFRKIGGDIVGMTGVPEVTLAKEAGLEYATLALVTNLAAGMQKKVSQEEVSQKMKKSFVKTKYILDYALRELSRRN